MQAAKIVKSPTLVIDPSPMTDEQRQAKEQAELKKNAKQVAKLLDTLAVHGKPLDNNPSAIIKILVTVGGYGKTG